MDRTPPLWPAHRAVAHLPGSLPMGGVVPMTPVHAFEQTPDVLRWQPQPGLQARRHDIELGGLLAFVIDELVTPAEADGVQGGNTRLYKPDGSGVDVSPVKGSALFFRHGFGRDSVRHVGCQVSGAVSKYVARINVMYSV